VLLFAFEKKTNGTANGPNRIAIHIQKVASAPLSLATVKQTKALHRVTTIIRKAGDIFSHP
jgi:hypothetical protein